MPKFVQLTARNGSATVYVNIDLVTLVKLSPGGGALICFDSDTSSGIVVQEAPLEVLRHSEIGTMD